jgi:hypothetical protein
MFTRQSLLRDSKEELKSSAAAVGTASWWRLTPSDTRCRFCGHSSRFGGSFRVDIMLLNVSGALLILCGCSSTIYRTVHGTLSTSWLQGAWHCRPVGTIKIGGLWCRWLAGTLRKNVSLVQKSRRTSIERSFFAECPWRAVCDWPPRS